MFSVYGSTGRVFHGTLEQMRQIGKVHAADRSRALEPTARDGHDSAVREAVEYGAPLQAAAPAHASPHRSAIAAYETAQQLPTHGWYDMAVSEVMTTSVLTLPSDATVLEAWQQLTRNGRGQAPVVNANGILVGMVTRADLLRFEQWPGASADPKAWGAWQARGIESIMVTPVPSVAPTTDLRRTASALLDSSLPGLSVVDEGGQVIGFVSRSDVLRAALKDAGLDVWG
jgi:CBS domain-containing protein